MIWCILDYAQQHLVAFWKKRTTNFNLIWLEWNSFNSSIQFHIIWSCSSFFKLTRSVDLGFIQSTILQFWGPFLDWFFTVYILQLQLTPLPVETDPVPIAKLHITFNSCAVWRASSRFLKVFNLHFTVYLHMGPVPDFWGYSPMWFALWEWESYQ